MSRRHRAEKREIAPDPIYGSTVLAKFINKVMQRGKKSVARRIVYDALKILGEKVKVENPLEAFEQALQNAEPALEVKSRRIGGATYQVPMEIAPARRRSLAMRWIIKYSDEKVGRSMVEGLAAELAACYHSESCSTIKKKDDTHRMAEANKAFAHYKW